MRASLIHFYPRPNHVVIACFSSWLISSLIYYIPMALKSWIAIGKLASFSIKSQISSVSIFAVIIRRKSSAAYSLFKVGKAIVSWWNLPFGSFPSLEPNTIVKLEQLCCSKDKNCLKDCFSSLLTMSSSALSRPRRNFSFLNKLWPWTCILPSWLKKSISLSINCSLSAL